MKRTLVFGLVALLGLYVALRIDKAYYTLERVKKDNWIYESGHQANHADLINPGSYVVKGDTLVFCTGNIAIVKYQYFDFLIISDSLNEAKGIYERLGSHRKK